LTKNKGRNTFGKRNEVGKDLKKRTVHLKPRCKKKKELNARQNLGQKRKKREGIHEELFTTAGSEKDRVTP